MIRIRGAHENNLAGVDLDLELNTLTAFVGRSGSGKSSLAFDTLHAEGQRRYLEALVGRDRAAASLRRPKVDAIDGLVPTVALDQRGSAPSGRATVATAADVAPLVRVWMARAGVLHCAGCDRAIEPRTHDEIVADIMAVGGRLELEAPVLRRGAIDAEAFLAEVRGSGFSRVRIDGEIMRIEDVFAHQLPQRVPIVVDRIRLTADKLGRLQDAVRTAARVGRGVVVARFGEVERRYVDRPYCTHCDRRLSALEPELFSWHSVGACGQCNGKGEDEQGVACAGCLGTRLSPDARAVRLQGLSVVELFAMTGTALQMLVAESPRTRVTEPLLDELARRLTLLDEVGLEGQRLDRAVTALSAGERQRLRLARHAGGGLSGVLYVVDEPAAYLDDVEVMRVIALLRRMVEGGNTVVVVAHHPVVIEAADRIVEFGPGAGLQGGVVVFDGDLQGLLRSTTPTGEWMSGRRQLPESGQRTGSQTFKVDGQQLPLGVVLAVTGSNGAGKSRLLELAVAKAADDARISRVVFADQRTVPRSPRSNPATYSGIWDVIRPLLAATREAKVRGFSASRFSLNAKGGRCEACKGTGLRRVQLKLLPDVFLQCPVCEGRRFAADVLEIRWRGLDASELLAGSASELLPILAGHPDLGRHLRVLVEVGLGYLPLGQPGHTLSGGEAQRLKLARELSRAVKRGADGTLLVLDDPTAGLHAEDTAVLVKLLGRLVDAGATVWMATHHRGLVAWADVELFLSRRG